MKKSNKILLFCFSAAAVAAAVGLVYLNSHQELNKYACIYEDGELIHKINLSNVTKPYTVIVGGNTILVEKGQISMLEADCPDKVCVKQGAISEGVRPIVCLPNNVLIKLTDDEGDTDITIGA